MKTTFVYFIFFVFALTSCAQGHRKTVHGPANAYLHTGFYYVTTSTSDVAIPMYKTDYQYHVSAEPIIDVAHFLDIQIFEDVYHDKPTHGIILHFDGPGTKILSTVTQEHQGQTIGLIINNKLVSVPKIGGRVTTGKITVSLDRYSEADLEEFRDDIAKKR